VFYLTNLLSSENFSFKKMSGPWHNSFRIDYLNTTYCKLCLEEAFNEFFDRAGNRRPREDEALTVEQVNGILGHYAANKKPPLSNTTNFGKLHIQGNASSSAGHKWYKLVPAGTELNSNPLTHKEIKDRLDEVNKCPIIVFILDRTDKYKNEKEKMAQLNNLAQEQKKMEEAKKHPNKIVLSDQDVYLLSCASKFQSILSMIQPFEQMLQARLKLEPFQSRGAAVYALNKLRDSIKNRRLEQLSGKVVCLAIDSSTRCNRTFIVATLHHLNEAFILRMIPKEQVELVEDDDEEVNNTFNGDRIAAILKECYAELAKHNIFVSAVASDRAPNMVLGIKLSGKLAVSCACHAFHHVGQALEADEVNVAQAITLAEEWYKDHKGKYDHVNKIQLPREQRWLDNVRFMTQIVKATKRDNVEEDDKIKRYQLGQLTDAITKLTNLRVAVRLCESNAATQIETLRALSVLGFEVRQNNNNNNNNNNEPHSLFSFTKLSQHQHQTVFETTIKSIMTPALLLVAYFAPINRNGIVHHINHSGLKTLFMSWFGMNPITELCKFIKVNDVGVKTEFEHWLSQDHRYEESFDREFLRKYFEDLKIKFPNLGGLLWFLSKVTSSEASAERAFYLLRRILVSERSDLGDDNVELCCQLSSFTRSIVDCEVVDLEEPNPEGEIFQNGEDADAGGVPRPAPNAFRKACEALVQAALEVTVKQVMKQVEPPNMIELVSKQCSSAECNTALLTVAELNRIAQTNLKKAELSNLAEARQAEIHSKLVGSGLKFVFCPQCRVVKHHTCTTIDGTNKNGIITTVCADCANKPDAKWW
jgi:hypothetical protein